jgi:hypothetical protein
MPSTLRSEMKAVIDRIESGLAVLLMEEDMAA